MPDYYDEVEERAQYNLSSSDLRRNRELVDHYTEEFEQLCKELGFNVYVEVEEIQQ